MMERRQFIVKLLATPFVAAFGTVCLRSSYANTYSENRDQELADPTTMKSFGYYQSLGATEHRSADRVDGTYYKMPCIDQNDVLAGLDKVYEFWHGHGNQLHQFTVTAQDFERLAKGESIEIFTNLVQGHRHSLRIEAKNFC
jgi:hypothetical protein